MNDVIYRQAAIDALTTECSWTFYDEHGQLTPNGEEILGTLKKIPSAQKKGHWKGEYFKYPSGLKIFFYRCSECGYEERHAYEDTKPSNFCPNCGADMRGEQNGNT